MCQEHIVIEISFKIINLIKALPSLSKIKNKKKNLEKEKICRAYFK